MFEVTDKNSYLTQIGSLIAEPFMSNGLSSRSRRKIENGVFCAVRAKANVRNIGQDGVQWNEYPICK
jgi:hypothetical protein